MAPAPTSVQDPVAVAAAGGIPLPINNLQMNQLQGLDKDQLWNLLQSTGLFKPGEEHKGDVSALANLAQQAAAFQAAGGMPGVYPGVNDPGPSSHPRGPPNMGQVGAMGMQATQQSQPSASATQVTEDDDGDASPKEKPASSGGRRGARGGAAMGSDEWARQRKDNHKEVERRRRGNINEGINELGRIVPSGSGEKAKGAILSRAVQYIHHLKENEARNIEKWTLEKLLMDQAMGDLQAQLEEFRRRWEEERAGRERAEAELEVLRGTGGVKTNGGVKRASEDGDEGDAMKRQKTE